ncbi:hypothetical protein B0T21DRAFT_349829 [Apiosordaria backusii]|uniref:Uncharacterized protein n=1 Tax=Apiosordaria backusii TaxID=314023 RepID=A0AA40E925_9PEZI|nr:hypothetical protein B0T21DRAFT_349829 [Apiosordaria backusii]
MGEVPVVSGEYSLIAPCVVRVLEVGGGALSGLLGFKEGCSEKGKRRTLMNKTCLTFRQRLEDFDFFNQPLNTWYLGALVSGAPRSRCSDSNLEKEVGIGIRIIRIFKFNNWFERGPNLADVVSPLFPLLPFAPEYSLTSPRTQVTERLRQLPRAKPTLRMCVPPSSSFGTGFSRFAETCVNAAASEFLTPSE